jgi:hypothetical protein
MTVSDAVLSTRPGGTSSDASIAWSGPRRGHLRRAEPGRQRRTVVGGDADRAARAGSVDRRDGASGRQGRRRPARSQGVDVGPRDDRRRQPHRSRRPAPCWFDCWGVVASGDGSVDAGHVPAGVHVRSCPPARSGHRTGTRAGLGGGCWARRLATGDRCRLDDLSSRRQAQARCRVRLHQGARLPPDPRHPGRHR